MAFTSFDEFEKQFLAKLETKTIPCGDLGDLTIREPAAVVFEPLDATRRELILRAKLDLDDPQDLEYLPDETKEKPREEWPEFSYLKFSPEDRGRWFANCADVICATATNGNGQMLFEGKEDFVKQWPGGLLTEVSKTIIEFVRRGVEETENPTTE